MALSHPPPAIVIVLLVLTLTAALFDVRSRRIPNWVSVSGVLIGITLNTFLADSLAGAWFSLKGLLLGFGVYFALYLVRAMGAGDVKLMGAVGSVVGAQNWFGIFVLTSILGGIMAIILAVAKKRVGRTFFNIGYILGEMRRGRPAYIEREELDVKNPQAVGLPHGAVIAVGSLFFLAISAHFAR
jgi:prepilin peptidase CpaA